MRRCRTGEMRECRLSDFEIGSDSKFKVQLDSASLHPPTWSRDHNRSPKIKAPEESNLRRLLTGRMVCMRQAYEYISRPFVPLSNSRCHDSH